MPFVKVASYLTAVIGSTVSDDYTILEARAKEKKVYSDSDCYGIALGRFESKHGIMWATWEFHKEENRPVSFYWGHYHMENEEAARRDFSMRE